MTKQQALIVFAAMITVVNDLLTELVGSAAAEELMSGVVTTAAPAAGSIVADLKTSKDLYDADEDTFVATQGSVDGMDDVADAIAALEIGDVSDQSGDAYDALQAASPD